MPRLRRADCSQPGITRRGRGRGFEYRTPCGAPVADEATLARIRVLAVPPAWTDVWISVDPLGHLQATGIDAAGRKQYLYHERWRQRRDREKFDRVLEFAATLPRVRAETLRLLGRRGLTRERVLACAVRLLDLGFFRIGGEEYAEENESFGLATLQKRHVRLGPAGELMFDYPAKSGAQRVQRIVDPAAYRVVSELKRRRAGGTELLAYKRDGRWCDVTSAAVNDLIRELTGGPYSAKDFRTWNATVLAAVSLAVSADVARSATARKRAKSLAVRDVARYLGNTPAVCRASYIDPRVFDRFDAGVTVAGALEHVGGNGAGGPDVEAVNAIDAAVLALLDGGAPAARRAAPRGLMRKSGTAG
jgi:DNA topoisomerase IB